MSERLRITDMRIWNTLLSLRVFRHCTCHDYKPDCEQICHQCIRIATNKKLCHTFASHKHKKEKKESSWANRLSDMANTQMLNAHILDWPQCPSVFWEDKAAPARTWVVQKLHTCAPWAPSFMCNGCQADLQPLGEVNHCMAWGQLGRAGEGVICSVDADLALLDKKIIWFFLGLIVCSDPAEQASFRGRWIL